VSENLKIPLRGSIVRGGEHVDNEGEGGSAMLEGKMSKVK
jgi:hypothetical protein